MMLRSHICLVGDGLTSRGELIRRLLVRNRVTLLETLDLPADGPILALVDLMALDCSVMGQRSADLIAVVRDQAPALPVVLADGGLTQSAIASLFNIGADDYFSHPFNLELMVERIEFLARYRREGVAPYRSS
jgi:DNA-binding response OmpR family regulator